ncbi:hypothetical protein QUF90_11860 [Desulfococcaceae bacterium HSG9]|nr:hypothetical protein [Desulfococcaceae bacterium HSG9]
MGDDAEKTKLDIAKYFFKFVVPILERKWLVCILFLTTFMIALPLGFLIKPTYDSEGMLQLFRPYSQVSPTGDKIEPLPAPPAYLIKEVELLQSNSFVSQVLTMLSDDAKADLENPLSPPVQIVNRIVTFVKQKIGKNRINKIKKLLGRDIRPPTEDMIRKNQIQQIKKRVSIRQQTRTAMVWITSNSFKNEVASDLVNSYIEIWKASNMEDNKKEINNKINFLRERRRRTHQDFRTQTDELIKFKKENEIPAEVSLISNMDIQLKLEQLESNVQMAKERFLMLDQKLIDTQLKAEGIVENVKILNPPETPIRPSKSKLRIFQLALALSGLFMGIGIAVGVDILKNLIRDESDITSAVGLPVLARLPKI